MLFNKKGTTPKGKTWGEAVENEKADAVEKLEPKEQVEGLNKDLELEEKEATPEVDETPALEQPKEEKKKPTSTVNEEIEEVEEDDVQDKAVHDIIAKYTGVDFKKMSKEKMFDVIYELLVELKKTRHSLSKYDYENLDFYQSTQKAISEKKSAEELIEYMARKLSPTYIKNIVDSVNKKCTPSQLADMILRDTFESKRKLQEKVIKLEEDSIQHKRLLDELKKQLTEQMNRRAVAVEETDREDVREETIDDFVASVEESEAVSSLGSKGGSIALVAIDIDKAKDALGEVEMAIIEIMGKEGTSLYPEILSKCVEERKYTESKVKTAFGRLEQYKVIAGEMVQTAKIKRGVRIADLTDEVGKSIYKDKFGANPVESEKARTIKDHGNLAHGYSIKETALILEGLGYQNVTTGRVENKISIGDNKYWVPDVIGINPITGKKEYFEVEFGNHNADNFDDKMTKANLKANILRFIVPSELVKTKIKNKVEHWRASQNSKLATMEISIGTVSDLESKTYGLEIK